ncbi:hypothetical protein OVY48_21375 [Sphingobium sp. SA2]|uniref:hypothetical protein n=1 Tax=Sphingobium sp. SA2 TaxID=1524832 RepID=UPI0028BF62EE|nr:hypothetical protein [Sphingobium sp. SA2]MDT7535952.1 hypothetical protein [Sphingobium sp. SA2]
MRNFLGVTAMFAAPWLVWLGFAHIVRPYWSGDVAALAMMPLSVAAGISGFWIANPPSKWKEKYLLALLVAYAILISIAQPFIGLWAVCTTGDCI